MQCRRCLLFIVLLGVVLASVLAMWKLRGAPQGPIDRALAPDFISQTCRCHDCHEWPAALLSANESCPLYLEALHQVAGMGHSFMSFNHVVVLAAELSLTLRTQFSIEGGGHGADANITRQYFFGESFNAAVSPFRACPVTVVHNEKALREVVQEAKNSCYRGAPVCKVFRTEELMGPSEAGLNVGMFRKMFELHEPMRLKSRHDVRSKFLSPWRPADSAVGKKYCIAIAVHIRRGDLLKYIGGNTRKAEQRFVPGAAYITLLRKFVGTLLRMFGSTPALRVILLCEGMRFDLQVQELDGSYADFAHIFRAEHVEVLAGPDGDVETFDIMCNADILVTSTSGFSHLSAVLCKKPVVLAIPFWHSFDCVPNALVCNVSRSVIKARLPMNRGSMKAVRLIDNITFDDHDFQRLLLNHTFHQCL